MALSLDSVGETTPKIHLKKGAPRPSSSQAKEIQTSVLGRHLWYWEEVGRTGRSKARVRVDEWKTGGP